MTHRNRNYTVLALGLALSLLLPAISLAQTGVMFVKNNAVGIGIAEPTFDLDVRGDDVRLNVRDTSAAAAARNMLTLKNNGAVKFALSNDFNSRIWQMSAFADFRIDVNDNAGVELSVSNSGNVTILGTLTENSSRDVKTNFEPVDPERILERLNQLELTTWTYKHDANNRHLGPFAEDFHAAFGLGPDNKHITLTDKVGVAMVAVQGLYRRLEQRDAQIERLELQNAALLDRLAAIEAQLDSGR